MQSSDTAVPSGVRRDSASALLAAEPWDRIVAKRIPVLVTGTDVSIDRFLDELKPLLPAPLTSIDCGSPLTLNGFADGETVVLRHLDRCELASQQQLLERLHVRPVGIQVIGTSSRSLFPLIATGAFLELLYYRLNIVHVELDPSPK